MGDIVDFAPRRGTTRRRQTPTDQPAETFVLVPNERLAQLRSFWAELKQQVDKVPRGSQPPAQRR